MLRQQDKEKASASVVASFAGPAGAGADRASWDSVLLELKGPRDPHHQLRGASPSSGLRPLDSGDFKLELWCFQEGWKVPLKQEQEIVSVADDSQGTGQVLDDENSFEGAAQSQDSVLEREETRVTLAGSFTAYETPALRLGGFRRRGLNQSFVAQPGLPVNGLPTWWSQDGRFFLYFAEEYGHWKANALRSAGGDGLRAVRPGGRRMGHGFAHSGPVVGRSIEDVAALMHDDGWFQDIGGKWTPVRPQIFNISGRAFSFSAARVEVEAIMESGEDSVREKHSGGHASFVGLRSSASLSAANSRVLLFVPPLPGLDGAEADEEIAGDIELIEPQEPDDQAETETNGGGTGDPNVLVVEMAMSRL